MVAGSVWVATRWHLATAPLTSRGSRAAWASTTCWGQWRHAAVRLRGERVPGGREGRREMGTRRTTTGTTTTTMKRRVTTRRVAGGMLRRERVETGGFASMTPCGIARCGVGRTARSSSPRSRPPPCWLSEPTPSCDSGTGWLLWASGPRRATRGIERPPSRRLGVAPQRPPSRSAFSRTRRRSSKRRPPPQPQTRVAVVCRHRRQRPPLRRRPPRWPALCHPLRWPHLPRLGSPC